MAGQGNRYRPTEVDMTAMRAAVGGKTRHDNTVDDGGVNRGTVHAATLNGRKALVPSVESAGSIGDSAPLTIGGVRYFPAQDKGRTVYLAGQGSAKSEPSTAGDPPLIQPPAQPVDTTQNASAPIVTRSHNEEYVQKKQQWSDNKDVKAAADKGFAAGEAYRKGDPMAQTPDYIRAGSKEYMERADMKVWAEANPEAAKALREKEATRERRWAAGQLGDASMLEGEAKAADGNLKPMKGSPTEGGDRKVMGLPQPSPKGAKEALAKARNFNAEDGLREVGEGALTAMIDRNPGMTRGQAVKRMRGGVGLGEEDPGNDRAVPTGRQVTDEDLDLEMEREGKHRNMAVDMIRTDQPMAHLTMGKPYTVPSMNRATANAPLQRAGMAQADATGTRGSEQMQPTSGLQAARSQKTPLRYEQGNIHPHIDQDMQERSDHISAERFAYEAASQIGKRMFGEGYSPVREKPPF